MAVIPATDADIKSAMRAELRRLFAKTEPGALDYPEELTPGPLRYLRGWNDQAIEYDLLESARFHTRHQAYSGGKLSLRGKEMGHCFMLPAQIDWEHYHAARAITPSEAGGEPYALLSDFECKVCRASCRLCPASRFPYCVYCAHNARATNPEINVHGLPTLDERIAAAQPMVEPEPEHRGAWSTASAEGDW